MRVLLILPITIGAMLGVPMDPEKIRELLAHSSRPKLAETMPKRSDGDEDIEDWLKRRGLRRCAGEVPDRSNPAPAGDVR